jgi:hypothetical protein
MCRDSQYPPYSRRRSPGFTKSDLTLFEYPLPVQMPGMRRYPRCIQPFAYMQHMLVGDKEIHGAIMFDMCFAVFFRAFPDLRTVHKTATFFFKSCGIWTVRRGISRGCSSTKISWSQEVGRPHRKTDVGPRHSSDRWNRACAFKHKGPARKRV